MDVLRNARVAVLAIAASWVAAAPTSALELELDAGGPAFVITDNDGAGPNDPDDPNDANPVPGYIDFTLDGSQVTGLTGNGRAVQYAGPIGLALQLTAVDFASSAVLRNDSGANMTVNVTLRSQTIPPFGTPLGWILGYSGEAADPLPDVVDVAGHGATLSINGGTLLTSLAIADISGAGDPPTPFSSGSTPGLDPQGAAASSEAVLSFTFGPGDELHVPVNAPSNQGLWAHVFNNDGRCVYLTNRRSADLAKAELREDAFCTSDARDGGPDATACVDGPSLRGPYYEAKVLDILQTYHCISPPPPWGVNSASCCNDGENEGSACSDDDECLDGTCVPGACATAAVQRAVNDYTHDLHGDPIVIGSGDVGYCQVKIQKEVAKSVEKAWKNFAKCKKDNFATIDGDVALAAACLTPITTDPKSAFVKPALKVQQRADRCEADGVTPLAAQFGGACSGAADTTAFTACVIARAKCRFCQAANVVDAVDPAFDCDDFDDGATNLSCAPIPAP